MAVKIGKYHLSGRYESQEMREGLGYLKNAFARINNELADLEGKILTVIGSLFKRHKYSAEDLLDSSQMNRIKSLAGKIKDDVSLWESVGGFFRSLYRAIVELLPVICQTLLFDRRPKFIGYAD